MDADEPAGEVPYGTLDLMVLKTLQVMGALHGYAIARRIEQVARGSLALNQGTIYPALLRLEQKGWIASKWGISETKRRVRFFTITRAGLRQLAEEQRLWGADRCDAGPGLRLATPLLVHVTRSATIGSTRMARRAGK